MVVLLSILHASLKSRLVFLAICLIGVVSFDSFILNYFINSLVEIPRALATLWTVSSDGFLLPRSKPLIYDLWTPKILATSPWDNFFFRRASLNFLPNCITSFFIRVLSTCIDFIKCCMIGLWIAIIQHPFGEAKILCVRTGGGG